MVRPIGTPNISLECINKILELHKARYSLNEIAKALGVSNNTARRYIIRYS